MLLLHDADLSGFAVRYARVGISTTVVLVRKLFLALIVAALGFTGCGGGGVNTVPVATTNSVTAQTVLGANGTTITLAAANGTTATILIAPVTVGAGSPVSATMTFSSVRALPSATQRAQPQDEAPPVPVDVSIHVVTLGPTSLVHSGAAVASMTAHDLSVQLNLPEQTGGIAYGNEDARVTDTQNVSTCAAGLSSAHTMDSHAGTQNLMLDNTVDLTNGQGTNATFDAEFTIDTAAATSQSRQRLDDAGDTCSASTSTSTSTAPTASPGPTASAAPSASAAPTASPVPTASALPTSSPAPSPSATSMTLACPYGGTFSGPLTDGRFTPPLVSTFTQTVTCSPPNVVSVAWSDPSYGTGSYSGTSSGLTVTLAAGQVINQYSADYNQIVSSEANSSQNAVLSRTGP